VCLRLKDSHQGSPEGVALRGEFLLYENSVHTLFLLTAVLASQPLELQVSTPTRLEQVAPLALPASQSGKRHLLNTRLNEKGEDDGTTTRVIVESAAGLGLGGVGLIVGSLALSDSPKLEETVIPMSLLVLGSSMGVTFIGSALDGRGRFGFALLGSIIGFVVPFAAGTGLLVAAGCNPDTLTNCGGLVPMVIGVLLLPSVGATIGYELSAPTPWLSLGYASSAPPPAPRLVPVVTLARQGLGVTLGLAGSL
jgi:hypothetical protein